MARSKNDPKTRSDDATSSSDEKTSSTDNKYDKRNSLAKMAEGELGDVIRKKSTLHQLTFKLTTEYKDAVTELATSRNEPISEVTRRALFAVLRNPNLLDEVEDTEREYRQSLGPSRHHK